jgi:hypothetical protein
LLQDPQLLGSFIRSAQPPQHVAMPVAHGARHVAQLQTLPCGH